MTDEEIIERLRSDLDLKTASDIARRLDQLIDGTLSRGAIVTCSSHR
jgi:flagellin-specific chaperone FliS